MPLLSPDDPAGRARHRLGFRTIHDQAGAGDRASGRMTSPLPCASGPGHLWKEAELKFQRPHAGREGLLPARGPGLSSSDLKQPEPSSSSLPYFTYWKTEIQRKARSRPLMPHLQGSAGDIGPALLHRASSELGLFFLRIRGRFTGSAPWKGAFLWTKCRWLRCPLSKGSRLVQSRLEVAVVAVG